MSLERPGEHGRPARVGADFRLEEGHLVSSPPLFLQARSSCPRFRTQAMQRGLLLLAVAFASCQPVPESGTGLVPLSGRQIYVARCIACHQADGSGIPAICPPLATSPRLTGPPEDLIRVMLLGMKGEIVRVGRVYNGIMPSWKFDLADEQIAEVINDLYARWNPAASPVTGEMVRRIREATSAQKLFPTAKELGLPD